MGRFREYSKYTILPVHTLSEGVPHLSLSPPLSLKTRHIRPGVGGFGHTPGRPSPVGSDSACCPCQGWRPSLSASQRYSIASGTFLKFTSLESPQTVLSCLGVKAVRQTSQVVNYFM